MFIAALFNNSKDIETTEMSIDRELGKEYAVPTDNGILLSH